MLNEVALNLKIGRDELNSQLKIMERMGYIHSVSENPSTCGTGCTFFHMAKGCISDNSEDSFGTSYQLTEKERRICGL